MDAKASFICGILGPLAMVPLAMMGSIVGSLFAAAVSVIAPERIGVIAGMCLTVVVTAFLPLAGTGMAVRALRRMRSHPCRNSWQAVAGLVLNAFEVAAVGILAVVLLCGRYC